MGPTGPRTDFFAARVSEKLRWVCAGLRQSPCGSGQPAGDVNHKPGGRLPLLSARPAVTPTTLKRAATDFAAW